MADTESTRPPRSISPDAILSASFLLEESTQEPNYAPIWEMQDLEYVTEPDENLLCPICHCPFEDPVAYSCQHMFCNMCLLGAFLERPNHRTCPSCRKSLMNDRFIPIPKVVRQILDELRVRCPLRSEGCMEILPRASVKNHLDKYCKFAEIVCPASDCKEPVRRGLTLLIQPETSCLHNMETICPDCNKKVATLGLEKHRHKDCRAATSKCKHCLEAFPMAEHKIHQEICLDRIVDCDGVEIGCTFTGREIEMEEHMESCTLAKIGPTIAKQQAQIEEHRKALKHFQRKSKLQDAFLGTVKETLASLPPLDHLTGTSGDLSAPFDSPWSHLLSLHETLREEVTRVLAAVSDLDAKTDTAFLNTSLRQKEEAAHRDAVIAQLRVQVQWLVSSRLQGMHGARAGGTVLGSGARRESDESDNGVGPSRPFGMSRRGSDGLGTGGREKL